MDGDLDGCHLLLMYGKANINSRVGGYTPIMWAAEYKKPAMAKYLAHYGADLSLVDKVSFRFSFMSYNRLYRVRE